MLPFVKRRRFSTEITQIKPTSGLNSIHVRHAMQENNSKYGESYSRVNAEICNDALEIRKLKTRIEKLSKDNALLRSFILSTKVAAFMEPDSKNKKHIGQEFEKLERVFD